MDITWYGLSCFKLSERGAATVITDPYDDRQAGPQLLKLAADIVTVSHAIPRLPNLELMNGAPYVVKGPGEYEVGGVFITGIQTDGQGGEQGTLYVFDFDPLTVAHLGNLDRILTQAEIEAIGTVNIALVPLGSQHGLSTSKAVEVINQLEPNIVIPMYYAESPTSIPLDTLSKFLKEMGLSEVAKRPSLKVTSQSLPVETQVIVLEFNVEKGATHEQL